MAVKMKFDTRKRMELAIDVTCRSVPEPLNGGKAGPTVSILRVY